MAHAQRWLERARTDPQQVAEELRALRDPAAAQAAAFGLRAAGPPGISALISALAATEPATRQVVIPAVGALPQGGGAAALLDRVAVEPVAWLRRELVRAAVGSAAPSVRDSVVTQLRDLTAHPCIQVRVEALHGLSALDVPAAEQAAAALARADFGKTESDHAPVDVAPSAPDAPAEASSARATAVAQRLRLELVWHAAGLLGRSTTARAAALAPWADVDDPFVAAQVAATLHALARPSRFEELGLHEPSLPADLAELDALDGRQPADLARAALALRLGRSPTYLRAALGRVAQAGDAADALVAAALRHPLPAVRQIALTALDRRKSAAVWQAYEHAVTSEPEPVVRQAILWTLGRRSEPETLGPLVRVAMAGPDDSRQAAVEALLARARKSGRARTLPVEDALIARLDEGLPAERLASAEALGRFTSPAARAALDRAHHAAEGALCDVVAQSLARIAPR